jgi:N utilization substance protein B
MSRRELRERIFKLLFRVEFNSMEDMPEQERLFFEEESPAKEEDAAYISDKYYKIKEKLTEIDALLNEKTEKWDTTRMSKVDLTILRLAVYEMKYDDSVPVSVAINEAVELAKKFGQDASPGFVNGILARLA